MTTNNILQFEQLNANSCKAINPMAKKIATLALSYEAKVQYFSFELGRVIIKDITKSFVSKYRGGLVTFPIGLINYIKEEINKKNYTCEFKYINSYELKIQKPNLPKITFEPYQEKIIAYTDNHKRGILIGSTGMGKSIVLGSIISKLSIPKTILIVPNQTIFNQMYDHCCNWFGTDKTGRIGQGHDDQKHITICLFHSLNKYKITRDLSLIMCDEVHLINKTIIDFLKKCNHVYYRYGVTATPQKFKNNFIKAAQMIGYIGPILGEIKDEEVSKRVLPVKIKLISYYCLKPIGKTYQECLRNDILYSTTRNTKFLKAAKLIALDKGLTCLILIDETEQGKIITKLAKQMNIPLTFIHGKIDGNIIKEKIKLLNERKIQCLLATKVVSTGTDIPNVDVVILASARKSFIDTLQKIGRGRRVAGNIEYTTVIDCVDKLKGSKKHYQHFYKHSLERLDIYRKKGWEIKKILF